MSSRKLIRSIFLAAALVVAWAAAGPMATAAEKFRYLVRSPHTAEECLDALYTMKAAGLLSKYEWGCKDGDHTGYAFVRATGKDDALAIVPESIRDKAVATKMGKFTAGEIQKFHDEMKAKTKPRAAEEDAEEEDDE